VAAGTTSASQFHRVLYVAEAVAASNPLRPVVKVALADLYDGVAARAGQMVMVAWRTVTIARRAVAAVDSIEQACIGQR
jgi:hypothetical protein